MNKEQRYGYEMLARVSRYGTDHKDRFPEASTGARRFAEVTGAVAAIDAYFQGSIVARAEARRVKAATRKAVMDAMKTIALAARRMLRTEPGENPFRVPRARSFTVEIATAKTFIQAAKARQEQFASFGLPATVISDLEARVTDMQNAIDIRLNSKTSRRRARAGLRTALTQGLDAARDLDPIVAIAMAADPVAFAAWQAARQIEGRTSAAPARAATSAASAASEPTAPAASVPSIDEAREPDATSALGKAS